MKYQNEFEAYYAFPEGISVSADGKYRCVQARAAYAAFASQQEVIDSLRAKMEEINADQPIARVVNNKRDSDGNLVDAYIVTVGEAGFADLENFADGFLFYGRQQPNLATTRLEMVGEREAKQEDCLKCENLGSSVIGCKFHCADHRAALNQPAHATPVHVLFVHGKPVAVSDAPFVLPEYGDNSALTQHEVTI